MRRLLLATLTASLLAGCGSTPTAPRATMAKTQAPVAPPEVKLIAGAPSVSLLSTLHVPAATAVTSQSSALALVTADSKLESVELLIQDGGAYFIQGWFSDLVDSVKRTWTRWKLSRAVKAALKSSHDKAFSLHEGEIDAVRKNRTAPVTKITNLPDDIKEIVSTWTSTDGGKFNVETRRDVDSDGVTQVLSVSEKGIDTKGIGIDMSRIRTLMGTDGTYKVATKSITTYKDGRKETQEWLKEVNVDGSEKLTGYILHPDGYRTDITGTRDPKGKVSVVVSKIAPVTKAP